MSAPAALDRLVFTTSRLAEFCSEKELVNQTGHDSDDWPLEAYRLFARSKLVEEAVEKFIKEMPAGTIAVPDDLNARVREYLDKNPESPWEAVVRYVVCEP